jgi:transposase-like protein
LVLEEGVRFTPRASKYPIEFKEGCVRIARESDRSLAAVARDLGVHPETLRLWVRQDEADDGTRSHRLSTAERRGACRSSPREPRLEEIQRDPEGGECVFRPRTRPAPSEVSAFVDGYRERFGVEPICREIEASASAYRARRVRPPSARAVRDEFLLTEIRRVHAESNGVYGQFKIWDELNDDGVPVAHQERRRAAHGGEA